MRRASIQLFAAVAAAGLALAFGAPSARAQVADCFQPETIPERTFDAVDDEYPLGEFGDRSCGIAAKSTAKGCKSVVKLAGGCRNLVSEALADLDALICRVQSVDKTALKTCLAAIKDGLKTSRTDIKGLVKEGAGGCADDVPPAILGVCNDPM
jgi:hypothetical protein